MVIAQHRIAAVVSQLGISEDFLALFDGGGCQFVIGRAFGALDDRFQGLKRLFSSSERLFTAAKLLIREVFGEGRASSAYA